jgi:hypothetical protein
MEDDLIPFAGMIPSLVNLQKLARAQCPTYPPEFIDSVAMLAQCAYEDFADWIHTSWPRKPIVNPSGFKRSNVIGLAVAYLKFQDNLINVGD